MASTTKLQQDFESFGHRSPFIFINDLDENSRSELFRDLESIHLAELKDIYESVTEKRNISSFNPTPFPDVCTVSQSKDERLKWYQIGLEKIYQGKLATLLLAGGQGTRLGTTYPKGMYDVGLPSKKSLFQIQAERLIRVQNNVVKRFGKIEKAIPWYIMTSDATKEPTKNFFHDNNYFGLDPKQIFFFEQEMLPCIYPDGKIIMETKTKVSRAPNGNGGLYLALLKSGALKDMEERGIEMVYQYCVDNALVKMADPTFAGFCFDKSIDCASKVISKAYPEEPGDFDFDFEK
eukprot:TRINITY_DN7369_c0_g1_i1.p1 TRINITY_DN7369_c0_g1~~TRINITY_DN7369_c0_g1_i1.p1  ORF type:complete len:292 (+),score=82.16 TRINITY_DN7369_c0_g1_i1:9-884(+)